MRGEVMRLTERLTWKTTNSDIYYCQLPMVKMLCNRWAESASYTKEGSRTGVTLILGAAIILGCFITHSPDVPAVVSTCVDFG